MTMRPLPLVLLALALPVAACTAPTGQAASAFGRPPSAAPSQEPAQPRGVVSVAEARTVLDQWDKAEADAQRQGGTGWTAAETGFAATMSKADSRAREMIGETVTTPRQAIVKPRFAIPGKVSGAAWFMAEFRRKGGTAWSQVIFKKTPDGWRMVFMSITSAKSRPPAVARDGDGLATALAPDDGDGLVASPRRIAQAHARLQATYGEDRDALRVFTTRAIPRLNADARRDERATLGNEWTMEVRSRPVAEVYALRTAKGGALVWYGIRQQNIHVARPGTTATMTFTDRVPAALSHGRSYERRAVLKSAGMYLAVVPRSPGPARVPAEWFISLSAGGS
ncbi:hypothetical protein E1295_08710 [Nonomuraea mesophila]|uniref:DUF8094 domain-containing protein n=1 Tax=Nonomuraea mesophila TaxID=2530382 RepID=A0A4V2ZBJ7_9ACTN|nr:hypothetical protein [Nonomuraea mesophila]TDE57195.1 hypothetical protein E1295_08710 [Nonomuraea mesophila]